MQIGADEGFELAKAQLSVTGYSLYTQVWNDQPPLHTFVVAQVLKHLSPSVLGPRLVTVVAAAVLLASMFWLVGRTGGVPEETGGTRSENDPSPQPVGRGRASSSHGWRVGCGHFSFLAGLTVVLLIASPGFLELSSSCMLEIPALAPAVLALTLLSGWQTRSPAAEIAAGILFGAALLMKLVPALLLPVAAMMIWMRHTRNWAPADQRPNRRRGFMGYLLVLVLSLVATFLLLDLLIEGGAYLRHFGQSWTSHFGANRSFEYGSPAEFPFDWSIFLKNWDLTVPALIGMTVSLRAATRLVQARWVGRGLSPGRHPALCASQSYGAWLRLLPAAWLVIMLVTFAVHRPWWSYYYLHIALPLCWSAAVGIVHAWHWVRWRRRVGYGVALGLFSVCAICWMGARLYLQAQGMRRSPQIHSELALHEIEQFKPFARFLYADEPIYCFHAGIPMPPKLAVLPLKRFWCGDMTNARLVAELAAAKPELLLLKTDTRERPFQDWLEAEYRLVYRDARHRLFALRAVAKAAGY